MRTNLENYRKEGESRTLEQIQMQRSEKDRKIYLDIIKIIAIFLVVYNHTNEKGYFLFAVTENSLTRPIYTAISVFCKISVPLFFMASGALLLNKEESLKKLYKKRVLRIIEVILISSILQQIYFTTFKNQEFYLGVFFRKILSEPIIIPYWYLYAYLSYLMILPFLRKIAKNLNDKEFQYLFTLFLILKGIAPFFCYFAGIEKVNVNQSFFDDIIVYPLAGYYMEYRGKEITRKKVWSSVLLGMAAIILMSCMTWKRAADVGELSEYGNGMFITALIAIPVFMVYYITKYVCSRYTVTGKLKKTILFFSGNVFGIYLLEERIRIATIKLDENLAPVIGYMPACFIWIFLIVVIAALVTAILKKIPGIRQLL